MLLIHIYTLKMAAQASTKHTFFVNTIKATSMDDDGKLKLVKGTWMVTVSWRI